MTKEEYRDTYGLSDAVECQNCGEFFPSSDAKEVQEPHGEYTPTCPFCGCDDLKYYDEVDMREEPDDETDM